MDDSAVNVTPVTPDCARKRVRNPDRWKKNKLKWRR